MDHKYTRLDPTHIMKRVFDESSDSNRVQIVGTEIAIAVSAADGDSVLSAPMAARHDLEALEELDCLHYQKAVLEAPEGVTIEATIDGETWFELATIQPRAPFEIMVAKIRPLSPCTMIVKA
jgi:hypothetical protein